MLAVNQPDFGHLTSEMALADGDEVPTERMLQPRAEGEIAFVLAKDLRGPGLTPADILTATKPWTAMREKVGNGQLALLFEGGWVYGGWAAKDKAATQANVGYNLHPTENGGPSFTVGGPGTCWYITAKSKNKQGAWEAIKAVNTKDIVAKLNIEDPHPVARTDSASQLRPPLHI